MSQYANLPPCGLPVDNATQPFWLSERSRLDRYRSTEQLPSSADLVIVGSGLSGAILAYHLLLERPNANIVMLEAREVCSGASARNGGQVKTDPYMIYNYYKKIYGPQIGNELLNFETGHLERFEKLLSREPIPCAFHVTSGFDVCMSDEMAKVARDSFHARRNDFPADTAGLRELSDPEELQRITGVKGGRWGAMYRVASIWPYKLATGLLERCSELAKAGGGSFNLQTMTPATAIQPSKNSSAGHTIVTARGNICTTQVVVCTNGYASNLLPEMANKVIPAKGTCSSLIAPTPQLPNTPSAKVFRPLFTSYALKFGSGGRGEYMISRQEGRKEMILGGAKHAYIDDVSSWYGVTDDSTPLPGAYKYFRDYMPKHFVNWPNETSNVDRVWTGILGYSSDTFPWVGQVPGRPEGIYIMAGFHGHGMCRIFGTAVALSELILSGKRDREGREVLKKAGLPELYIATPERLRSTENRCLDGVIQPSPQAAVKAKL